MTVALKPIAAKGSTEIRRGFQQANVELAKLAAGINSFPVLTLGATPGLALSGAYVLTLDVSALTEDAAPAVSSDFVPTYNADGSPTRAKAKLQNLINIGAYSEKAVPAGTDYVLIRDASASGENRQTHKKVLLKNLPDIASQTELALADIDRVNDYVLIWDASGTGTKLKKTKVGNVGSITDPLTVGTLNVTTLLKVNTNKFTVDASGNVVIAGTLSVTGLSTLGAVRVNGLTVNGAMVIGGSATIAALTVTTSLTLPAALPVASGGSGGTAQSWVDLTTNQSSIGGAKTFTVAPVFSAGMTLTGKLTANDSANAITIGNGCTMTSPPPIGGTGTVGKANSGRFSSLTVTGLADVKDLVVNGTVSFKKLNTTQGYYVNNNKVVGERGASIFQVLGYTLSSTYNAAEVASVINSVASNINEVLRRMRASTGHGLIAG